MFVLGKEEGCFGAGEFPEWLCSPISFYMVSAWLYSFADLSSLYCLSRAFCLDSSLT